MAPAFELRSWHLDDLPVLVEHASDPGVAGNMTDAFPHPYTADAGRAFIHMATQGRPPRIFCIALDGVAVGSIGIHPQQDIFRRNAELGYWLARPYWGQGIITEAIRRTVVYAFDTFPIDRVFARPFGSNRGSQRALEKAGFALEARLTGTLLKNDRVEDELIYAIRR